MSDAILRRMDENDADKFDRGHRSWQERVLKNMKNSGDFEPL